MQRMRFIILGILLAGGALAASAQTPNRPPTPPPQLPEAKGEIRGSVLDESGAPISGASVAIRSKPDSALVAGAIAGANGAFRIQGLRPGTYSLRVTSLGFRPRTQELTIGDASPRVAVGGLRLSRVAVTLEGVQVTSERATVTIEPDRNSYRAKDVAPSAGNASEVLDAVPSVQVDGDGKVSLRGNENVAVHINGRPSPLRGTQLGAYLKALPANVVERVEVVPNPSAKHDPEGMAGIINIVLKQNADLGWSGGVNASFANEDRHNGSGNVGYQRGPLTLFTSYGHHSDHRGVFGINDRERYDALRSLLSITEQDIEEESGSDGHNFYTSADYKLNPRDVLSNAVSLNVRRFTNGTASAHTELSGSGALLGRYDRLRDTESDGVMVDYTAALKRTFEPRKHEVSVELRLNRSHDEDRTTLWKQPRTSSGLLAGSRVEGEIDDLDAVTRQLTGQLDYTRSLAKRTKLESGYKGTARWLDRDYVVRKDDLGIGDWLRSDLSNAFTFDEKVHALYAVLSHGIAKFDLQAGLRAEYASRDFALSEPAASYPYDYGSLFPSGVVLYNLSDATQLKLSYSRRVRRPGTQELNPFPSFFDVQNVFIGNPNLSPEYTDAFELGYTRNGKLGSVQVSPFYRRTSNVIRVDINTADTLDGREVTTVTFRNLATSNSWGADVNGTLRLGSRFNGFAGFNVFKIVTDGGSQSVLSSSAVTWMGRVNGTTQLSKTFSLQGSYFYRAPMKIERGRFGAAQSTSFTMRQKVRGDAAVVGLRVVDPFKTGAFKIRAGDDNVVQITERNFGVRAAFLTFQFNYGQAPRIRQRQDQPEQRPGFPTGG
ncbi:MAG: TonB-dependent receptor domain-containing protein [Gemmatimonadaceae bacterium]